MLAQMVRPPSGSATPPSDGADRSRRETHPAPKRERVRPVFLLAGLVAAPLAWIIQICTSEALASHACFPMGHPLSAPELTSLLHLVAMVSAACFVLSLAGFGRGLDVLADGPKRLFRPCSRFAGAWTTLAISRAGRRPRQSGLHARTAADSNGGPVCVAMREVVNPCPDFERSLCRYSRRASW